MHKLIVSFYIPCFFTFLNVGLDKKKGGTTSISCAIITVVRKKIVRVLLV
jgi:hypothetical protein